MHWQSYSYRWIRIVKGWRKHSVWLTEGRSLVIHLLRNPELRKVVIVDCQSLVKLGSSGKAGYS
jgi:hypothetical protein